MGGVEGMDRATFKKVSEIFNAFVFELSPAPAPAPALAPATAPATVPAAAPAPKQQQHLLSLEVTAAITAAPSQHMSAPAPAQTYASAPAAASASAPAPATTKADPEPVHPFAPQLQEAKCKDSCIRFQTFVDSEPSLCNDEKETWFDFGGTSENQVTSFTDAYAEPIFFQIQEESSSNRPPMTAVAAVAAIDRVVSKHAEMCKEVISRHDPEPSEVHQPGIDCSASESVTDFVTAQHRLPDIAQAFGSIVEIDSCAYDCQDQGRDIVATTPAPSAAVNETPLINARHHPIPASADTTTSFSIIKAEVISTIKRKKICFLHQKPGFGKTRIIMELLSKESFLIIFVPTKVLKAQVTARTSEHSYMNLS
jgi:hypothetical protein